MREALAAGSSISVWKAATMGLVMSLANPHSANSTVMTTNGSRYFFSTSFINYMPERRIVNLIAS